MTDSFPDKILSENIEFGIISEAAQRIMDKLTLPITEETFERETSKWLETIAHGECGSVLFFPKQDRFWRLPQLLKDENLLKKYLKKPENYLLLILDFNISPISKLGDLEEYLIDQINRVLEYSYTKFDQWLNFAKKENRRLVLLVIDADKLLEKKFQPIFYLLARLYEENLPVQTLLFFERDITHPDYFDLVSTRTTLFENLFHYPLYKRKDVEHFISYYNHKWNLSMPQDLYREIVQQCGGHFWLVKQAVRYFRQKQTKKDIFTHRDIKLRIAGIYNSLLESEKSVLKKITFGKKSFDGVEEHSLRFLQRMNLIENDKITIPLLVDYIKSLQETDIQIGVEGGNVLLNGVPIDVYFSKKEHNVLRELVNQKGKIVSRDRIAEIIWSKDTDEKYSDWAIDQTIARIRKKLGKLYVSPKNILTARGKGYRFVVK